MRIENITVSIIVPVYNSAAFLPGLFASLREMDFSDWECIFVNNLSSDNSLDLLNSLRGNDERFVIRDIPQRGVSAARNCGLQLARGKYIQFLDADDFIASGKLRLQSAYLDKHSDCGLVFGDARYWKDTEPGVWIMPPWSEMELARLQGVGEPLFVELLKGNRLVISSPLFRSSLVDLMGTMREDMDYNEDWEFWLRMSRTGVHFHLIARPETLSYIRLHTISASRNLGRMYRSELEIYQTEFRNPSNSKQIRSTAKKYFYKTWIEIVARKLKGDIIKTNGLPVWI